MREIKYFSGQPCNHNGCLSHVTHPCEGCGRKQGIGNVYYYPLDALYRDLESLFKEKKEIG